MIKYLIDSDVLIDFFKGREYAVLLLDKLTLEECLMAISVLTVAELRTGWTEKEADNLLPQLYRMVKVLSLEKDMAEMAGQLRREYSQKGRNLPLGDTLIAATAIIEGCQFITRNVKDYPMLESSIYPL